MPTSCPQAHHCERAALPAQADVPDIDGTRALVDGWCVLFVDVRGLALLEAA